MKTPDHNSSLVLCKKKPPGVETAASCKGKNIPPLLYGHIPVPVSGNNAWRKFSFQAEGLQAENKSALRLNVLVLSISTHLQWSFKPLSAASTRNIIIPKGNDSLGSSTISSHDLLNGVISASLGLQSSLLGRR